MKKTLIIFLLLGLFSVKSWAATPNLPFSIGEWPPYTGISLPGGGIAAEIVTALSKAAGLGVEYSFVPWKRAEMHVRSGLAFATFPYQEIPERQAEYLFSSTLFSTHFSIAAHRKRMATTAFQYSRPEDLRGYRVGIIAGTDAIKLILQKSGALVEEVDSARQNLGKLDLGRIDFYIDDSAVLKYAIAANYPGETPSRFTILKTPFGGRKDWKIMVSRQYPDAKQYLERLNAGLVIIRNCGELQDILANRSLE